MTPKTIDFSLNDARKITAFNYSHSLGELVGSWSASIAGGSFEAGDAFTINNVMKNGIISNAYKDSSGLWHLEGKDAGFRLMKSLPDIADIPKYSRTQTFIRWLAEQCSIQCEMSIQGLDEGFDLRSLISGSTYAEAILELAMFSGCIAYINKSGSLVVAKPRERSFPPASLSEQIINDSGSSIDLDGYATHVAVQLTYKAAEVQEQDDDDDVPVETGEDLPTQTYDVTESGLFEGGEYSVTTLMPFGVVKRSRTQITNGSISVVTVEEHQYRHEAFNLWRDNQEFGLYALIETGYTLTRTTTGSYSTATGEDLSFSEQTVETMARTLSPDVLAVGIPEEWQGRGLHMVGSETITRTTTRTGGRAPEADMPAYAPEFDSRITREYSSRNSGRILICKETEQSYEARQVGSVAPVKKNGTAIPHFFLNSRLAIQTHSTPQWVLVKSFRTYLDQYDTEGNCTLSTRSEYSDDGAEWLTAHALSETGDDDADDYQKAYAKFSQEAQGLQVAFGSSSINTAWQFLELRGHTKTTASRKAALGEISSWYDAGSYVRSTICPHYNQASKSCNIYMFAGDTNNFACTKSGGPQGYWQWCNRALAALEYARGLDASPVEAPVVGTASLNSSATAVGYKREVYIDEEMTTAKATRIANTLAQNILEVKGSKGIRKTLTIPYSPNYQPDGDIVAVSHDWENLQTAITYRTEGTVPDFLISQSVAAVAEFVSARSNARLTVPKYGVVSAVNDDGSIEVSLGSYSVECSTKVRGVQVNDTVLVTFPAGNKLRGQVISRL